MNMVQADQFMLILAGFGILLGVTSWFGFDAIKDNFRRGMTCLAVPVFVGCCAQRLIGWAMAGAALGTVTGALIASQFLA